MSENGPTNPEALSDDQLLNKARHAANGRKFRLRFERPYEDSPLAERYETRRQAEIALMENLAFWTQRNTDRMWRLFKRSKLYDEKAETYREYPAYRRALIKEALDLNSNVYGKMDDYGSDNQVAT